MKGVPHSHFFQESVTEMSNDNHPKRKELRTESSLSMDSGATSGGKSRKLDILASVCCSDPNSPSNGSCEMKESPPNIPKVVTKPLKQEDLDIPSEESPSNSEVSLNSPPSFARTDSSPRDLPPPSNGYYRSSPPQPIVHPRPRYAARENMPTYQQPHYPPPLPPQQNYNENKATAMKTLLLIMEKKDITTTTMNLIKHVIIIMKTTHLHITMPHHRSDISNMKTRRLVTLQKI